MTGSHLYTQMIGNLLPTQMIRTGGRIQTILTTAHPHQMTGDHRQHPDDHLQATCLLDPYPDSAYRRHEGTFFHEDYARRPRPHERALPAETSTTIGTPTRAAWVSNLLKITETREQMSGRCKESYHGAIRNVITR